MENSAEAEIMPYIKREENLESFAKRFLAGRINWFAVPKRNAIINFGNVISLVLYRKLHFQVELFISPFTQSSFTYHRHPNVDTMEFGLCGEADMFVNGMPAYSQEQLEKWLNGEAVTQLVRLKPDDWHSGCGRSPYAFLSIQHWLNNVEPTSVGLDWVGEPSSIEQEIMWHMTL